MVVFTVGAILFSVYERQSTTEANHAWLHGQGIGYDGVGPGDFGWVNVHIIPQSTGSYAAALTAVDNWRSLHVGAIWWLRHTDVASEAQGEVVDRDTATVFGGADGAVHLYVCNTYFVPTVQRPYADDAYATTIVTDSAGDLRSLDANGFWAQRLGVPFWHATACLNSHHTNDSGTIAHELGHVLGLDHPTVSGGTCTNTGLRTIMAYNYLGWAIQWPPGSPPAPTDADLWGPWVCDSAYLGGLAYVYDPGQGVLHAAGMGTFTPTATPTRTATRTPTPTSTPTPTATPVDNDGDGFLNPQQALHTGPANTDANYDNCPSFPNASQLNSDGDFVDLPTSIAFDDLTWPNSDALGDACDPDADNDGLSNVAESGLGPGGPYHGLCPSASANTDPLLRDTDGDRVLDGAECALGYDPASAASTPPLAPAGDTDHDGLPDAFEVSIGTNPLMVDTDGDKINDGVEVMFYNSNPLSTDTDGDGCPDGKEIGSVNDDRKVNSTDQLLVGQHFGNWYSPSYILDFDINRDGHINSTDQYIQGLVYGVC